VNNKIIINLVPITKGGGLQNAINFIIGFNKVIDKKDDYFFIFKKNIILEKFCKEYNLKYKTINNTLMARLLFECFYFINKKNNIIFTLYGGKPLFTYNNKMNIVGCAYSNLFYPEVKFWSYLSKFQQVVKLVIDKYRFYSIRKADVYIFETDVLAQRAIKLFNFPKEHTYVVKMAINSLIEKCRDKVNKNLRYTDKINKKFKILYLAGAHPNKRQHLLIELVKNIIAHSCKNIIFITTMSESKYTNSILNKFIEDNLENYILNIGPIDNDKCAKLISECDAMINIALLESFSNNFVEAWAMRKPLFVTDVEWSKSCCGNAAIYLNMKNPSKSAEKIINICSNSKSRNIMIKEGVKQLENYPTTEEKTRQYINIINKYRKV